MKISKRTREQAALICAIAASTPSLTCKYDSIRAELGGGEVTYDARDLALDAWVFVRERRMDLPTVHVDAEAHALLMSGWSPGDKP